MKASQLLTRAKSAIGKGTIYQLGAGGMNPGVDHPGRSPEGSALRCDCSGFTAWVFGFSRQTRHPFYVRKNGGWINTDAMHADALDCVGFFTKLDEPIPGCIVVYPGGAGGKIGHVGIVSEVKGGKVTKVIHCSSGNFRAYKDAIRETPPDVFNRSDALFAWFEGVER